MCGLVCVLVFFFFFKQKTAYEMRISDWSSDVCSSDLQEQQVGDLLDVVAVGDALVAQHMGIVPDLGDELVICHCVEVLPKRSTSLVPIRASAGHLRGGWHPILHFAKRFHHAGSGLCRHRPTADRKSTRLNSSH